ncbi:MAG: AbrB/MazE/SpoVT family DNA-binding domain-containing protein [Caulobacter sp.]|nr:AbrB/MazE/SpoVT family DNA-binding domain-containing protein [Caulobacter sp.]
MTRVTVGRWGKSLALRVPLDVVQASGLADGEQVEIELKDGDIVIRRPEASTEAQARALKALDRLFEKSKGVTLGDVTIREMIEEGRRG